MVAKKSPQSCDMCLSQHCGPSAKDGEICTKSVQPPKGKGRFLAWASVQHSPITPGYFQPNSAQRGKNGTKTA